MGQVSKYYKVGGLLVLQMSSSAMGVGRRGKSGKGKEGPRQYSCPTEAD